MLRSLPLAGLVLLASCVGLSSNNVTGTTATLDSGTTVTTALFGELLVSPGSLDFGFVDVGAVSTLSLSMENAGAEAFYLNEILISGSSAFHLITDDLAPAVMDPGVEVLATVEFIPDARADFEGSLVISTSAPGAELVEIPLTGTASSGTVTGTTDGGGLTASPGTINFGTVDIGSTGSQVVTIKNTGTEDLLVQSIESSDPVFDWGGELNLPYVLRGGDSKSITMTYAPGAEVVSNGTSTIYTDDPDSPAVQVSLTGEGLQSCTICRPIIDVNTSDSSGSDTTMWFLDVGGLFSDETITILNVGDMPLEITDIPLTNGSSIFSVSYGDFQLKGYSGPFTVNAGSSYTLTLTYNCNAPAGEACVESNLDNKIEIYSNDSFNSPWVIKLSAFSL